ncbi:MAG: flagellar hook-length control protein FliK [Gammaproteobacteria bacterium]|nr:flagellar hook-length control protein FliK [Gammaproteobacteria bacterium]
MTTTIPTATAVPKALPTTGLASAVANSTAAESPAGPVAGDNAFAEMFSTAMLGSAASQDGPVVATDPQDTPPTPAANAVPPDGNPLPTAPPFMAWAGTVVAADDQGARAVAMEGDNTLMSIGKLARGTDIPAAVQAALQQPRSFMPALPLDNQLVALPPVNALAMPSPALSPLLLAKGLDPTISPTALTADSNPNTLLTTAGNAVAFSAGHPTISYAQVARPDQAVGSLAVPLDHPQWANQLGEGVRWMTQQHIQQADLHLNPPDLGLLEVRIQLHSDQANITFCSPHAPVRDAVEHAIPRLRDMLGDTGIQLGDVNVSQQSLSQHQHPAERFSAGIDGRQNLGRAGTDPAEIPAVTTVLPRYGRGLVDLYA